MSSRSTPPPQSPSDASPRVTLGDLCSELPGARILGDARALIARIEPDSRSIRTGDLFVAERGLRSDGHDHVAQAIANGATAVVVERDMGVAVPQLIVSSTRQALGLLAARQAGHPSRGMTMVGVTGTNGKTSFTYLLEAILLAAGARPGIMGTVNYRFAGTVQPAEFTTPVPTLLQDVLAQMARATCTHAVMEVSSAALAMDRVEGLSFQTVAFSNLTQDHLDLHGDMEGYFGAKARLASDYLAPGGTVVALTEEAGDAGDLFLKAARPDARRVSASTHRTDTDVHVATYESSIQGLRARVVTPRGELILNTAVLFGRHNVANLVLAIAVAESLGVEHDAIVCGIATFAGVPGRLERVPCDEDLGLFVDYAHTPDALERVMLALRPLARGRLIVVFGCGGDRDRSKRPLMGKAVALLADVPVITSDNPRTEDPTSILNMIQDGVTELAAKPTVVEVDRRRAIEHAVAMAQPGDVVLIAGKGHEDYQILGTTKIHFDDREETTRAAGLRGSYFPIVLDSLRQTLNAAAESVQATTFTGAAIDGRALVHGDIYFAIKGESFDGHDFCAQAIARGATALVVSRGRHPGLQVTTLEVDDPRAALGHLGAWVRDKSSAHIVGITGSSGKTTTKSMVGALFQYVVGESAVLCPSGSLNNETGVPLTLLALRRRHRFAVIEMGMRGTGQIDYLGRFVRPDVGVVLNAQLAHLGVVGSISDIVNGKSEMFSHARRAVVYPSDDPRLVERAKAAAPSLRHVTFGSSADAVVRLVAVKPQGAQGSQVTIALEGREHTFLLPLVGAHNAANAAAAVAVAHALEIPVEECLPGLALAQAQWGRSQAMDLHGRHVLADYYNANPTSMAAAIDTLGHLGGSGKRVAVLGDMRELGPLEREAHLALGPLLANAGVHAVLAFGPLGPLIAEGARAAGIHSVETTSDPTYAGEWLASNTRPDDWVLLKASRGVKLERVLTHFHG